MTSTIAIAGISSKLALLIAHELLKSPDVRIHGSSRDVSKLPRNLQQDSRVSLIQAEATDTEALRSLVRGSQVVICCYFADNATMLDGQKLLIDLCEEEGISRYIASDFTGNFAGLDWGDIVMKDPMKNIQAYLELKKPKIQGVHVLVGIFLEIFLAYFGVWDPKAKKFSYWGTGNEKWDLTTYQTAAEYVAAVALDQDAVGLLKCNVFPFSLCVF